MSEFPFPRTNLSLGFSDGCAERGEDVQDSNTHLQPWDLTVEDPCGQVLAEELHTVHLGLGAASAVIPALSSPDGSTDALRCSQDLGSCNGASGLRLPGLRILAGRDDGGGTAGGDGVAAFADVEGAIGGDGGDLLLGRDLVEQVGQHGRIARVADGELRCTDFQGFIINANVDLAPDPSLGTVVLARVLLASTRDLDPGAVDQKVQRAV